MRVFLHANQPENPSRCHTHPQADGTGIKWRFERLAGPGFLSLVLSHGLFPKFLASTTILWYPVGCSDEEAEALGGSYSFRVLGRAAQETGLWLPGSQHPHTFP